MTKADLQIIGVVGNPPALGREESVDVSIMLRLTAEEDETADDLLGKVQASFTQNLSVWEIIQFYMMDSEGETDDATLKRWLQAQSLMGLIYSCAHWIPVPDGGKEPTQQEATQLWEKVREVFELPYISVTATKLAIAEEAMRKVTAASEAVHSFTQEGELIKEALEKMGNVGKN